MSYYYVPGVACVQEVYCKMRCLADRGCLWVGHGLNNDFRALNLYIPPENVRAARAGSAA